MSFILGDGRGEPGIREGRDDLGNGNGGAGMERPFSRTVYLANISKVPLYIWITLSRFPKERFTDKTKGYKGKKNGLLYPKS